MEPNVLEHTYFDYAPDGYTTFPVRIQQKYGNDVNNVYAIYQAQLRATDIQNTCLSHITPYGSTLTSYTGVGTLKGGYPAFDFTTHEAGCASSPTNCCC